MSLLKLLKRCARMSMRGNWGESIKMAKELNLDREGLPNSTTEREIIEQYFHRGIRVQEYCASSCKVPRYTIIRENFKTIIKRLWFKASRTCW